MLPRPARANRRSFLGLGMLGGLAMPLLNTASVNTARGSVVSQLQASAKNVLVVLEQGGMSHIDTWDPKPEAVSDHRSPFKPIDTNVPGIQFTSLLAKTARVADKLAIIRSMYHKTPIANGHPLGTQYALSGVVPGGPVEMPDIGSVVAHLRGSECHCLPPYIMVPGNDEQAAMTRHGFLPASTKVFKTGGRDLSDPKWRVPDLSLAMGIDQRRFHDRLDLLSNVQVGFGRPGDAAVNSMSAMVEQATDVLTNPKTQAAFRLADESEQTREAYGRGHRGQCYLLGRKLIESGVRFVTVDVREPETSRTPGGFNMNWDHHDYMYRDGSCGTVRIAAGGEGRYGIGTWPMMGSTDQAFAALIEDLHQRGLLAETLVCFVTEFGRTPKLNRFQGRDHWINAYSIVMAGAGIPGGQIVGRTDRDGGFVLDRGLTPDDYAATVYAKVGIDRELPLHTSSNRPIFLTPNSKPIREMM